MAALNDGTVDASVDARDEASYVMATALASPAPPDPVGVLIADKTARSLMAMQR